MLALISRWILLIHLAGLLVAARLGNARRADPLRAELSRPGRARHESLGLLAAVPAVPRAAAGSYGDLVPPAPLPLPRLGGQLRRAARRLARAGWLDLAIVGTLLAVVGVVHAINMGGSPAFFDDEGTYVSQAWAVTHLGELAPYTYWYDHPPLGWLVMAAWSLATGPFTGGASVAEARGLMFVLALADAALLYAIARRLGMRRPFAALAVALFALSPLAVHYQRMVLLDNLGVTWLLAAFALALSPARRLGAYGAAGICFAGAVLSKETLLLVLPALVLLLWQRTKRPTRAFSLAMFLAGVGLIAGFYPLFALLRGELLQGTGHTSLMYGVDFQLTRPGGGSLTDPNSGTRQLIRAWLHDDPVLLSAGALLAPVALAVRRLRAVAVALVLPVVVAARPGSYVPAMFVIALLPFAALIVAGLADGLRRPSARPALIAAALAAVVVVGPRWASGNLEQMRDDDAAPARQAINWVDRHVDHRSTIVVDNTMWVDLVERGFARQNTIWFYKLDLDPAVTRPRERVDYVVRSNIMEFNARDLPRTRDLLTHSRPVALFERGAERFEVRKVMR
jgi:4-amino-4-deoxy-L-arabinose transferase-like glycosyltransferase